ncbi:hypothetical protein C1H87_16950 [Flavivirga eckloniae]|uniref:Uncharacterized protein n=1 Tax=Flavivirga eckloniae TaxID=1803846 RepID=A0A2K9PTB1_9FLAO|nr:hypothetical protein C1H87_16950 [Flavivirga eckloniae]
MALYATIHFIFFALYAQILLGFVQILIALILLFFINRYNKKIKRLFAFYWGAALTTLILIYLLFELNPHGSILKYEVFIIPMLIASYFVYITYLIQKQ